MYEYRATVLKVVDGDTVWLDVDLGMDIHTRISCRLAGIDAPEMSTPEGQASATWVRGVLEGKRVLLKTIKDKKEKYGRYLAVLYLDDYADSVNDELIAKGLAKPYSGGQR